MKKFLNGSVKNAIFASFILIALIGSALTMSSCTDREVDQVSYNLSLEADNFNNVRQITVINCIKGDILFQMTGKMSIQADPEESQLEVIVEDNDGGYKKHFIGLSDNVTYVVEDITTPDVSKYKYEFNFNPKMWLPYKVETVD